MTRIRNLALAIVLVLRVPFIHAQADVSPATLTFTTIDVPGAGLTVISGINSAGNMVGWYAQTTTTPASGFLLSGGNFVFFDYPGGNSTLAREINDSGQIVGYAYIRQSTAAVGFLYDGATFTKIRVPGKSFTLTQGVNNTGTVVGGDGSFGGNQGFELIGGKFKNITPPGSCRLVYATSVNNLGEIVGWTSGGVGSNNAFAYKGGKFQTIIVPGSNDLTEAWGVNDGGIIVGWYCGCSPSCADHGFVLMNGEYLSFDYPGAVGTFAEGISASGEIVGSYTTDNQTYHGFVTSPVTATEQAERRPF